MTIEERAYEEYPIVRGDNTANDAGWSGYVKGANEMLIKACSEFCDQCNRYYAYVHAKDCSLNRATCEKLNTFRKALGE